MMEILGRDSTELLVNDDGGALLLLVGGMAVGPSDGSAPCLVMDRGGTALPPGWDLH